MIGSPSAWVVKYAPLIPHGGRVLDLACGNGRHAIWLAQLGYQVDAIDRDAQITSSMENIKNIKVYITDLEENEGAKLPHSYDGIIVCRYLHRPLLKTLAEILNPGGVLIYETFMSGNERYGKPSNPNFLLLPDELLVTYSQQLRIVAFEQGEENKPKKSVMQRICAIKEA